MGDFPGDADGGVKLQPLLMLRDALRAALLNMRSNLLQLRSVQPHPEGASRGDASRRMGDTAMTSVQPVFPL